MKEFKLKSGMRFSVHPDCKPYFDEGIVEIMTIDGLVYIFPIADMDYYLTDEQKVKQ